MKKLRDILQKNVRLDVHKLVFFWCITKKKKTYDKKKISIKKLLESY
jgi:hypothetical protein